MNNIVGKTYKISIEGENGYVIFRVGVMNKDSLRYQKIIIKHIESEHTHALAYPSFAHDSLLEQWLAKATPDKIITGVNGINKYFIEQISLKDKIDKLMNL